MTQIDASSSSTCPHCNAPAGKTDVSYGHSPWDPLQVAECGSCGRILAVEGHDW